MVSGGVVKNKEKEAGPLRKAKEFMLSSYSTLRDFNQAFDKDHAGSVWPVDLK